MGNELFRKRLEGAFAVDCSLPRFFGCGVVCASGNPGTTFESLRGLTTPLSSFGYAGLLPC